MLRQHGVEIVHTNDGPMHATWALPTVLAGAKLFWHHRGDPQARGANMLAPLLASHVVTVSKFAQPSNPLIPLNDRISVIHSPFDHPQELPDREECRLALAQELGLDPRTHFVGYFGSLIDRKKPLRFVEAVHAFHKKNPDFPLVGLLFGRPEKGGLRLDEDAQALAASLGIADKIRLMGFRLPVAPYMRAVDILLVPALNEPFGRTLIEAMLLGTPVIATNHGGNPEAIDHGRNGYLVEPENPSAFVEPMETLLMNEEEWRRISETARVSALASYGVEYHVNGITRLYQHILGRDQVNGRPH
ncbi:glycosyltransferase [Sinorhizobium sp. BG8]|uniref:glycosyltransferase n=1 Tax=Sinorhizobium sp. BG8 TaxID=2613773 RepID=UPI00193D9EB5|nr:glycosyltransferase [Sinorhizobium sp. BG8]QRM57458.1 glycosyltransferase [Sinorhizobium sp. BG8]